MHAARELKTGKIHQLPKNFAAHNEMPVTDLSKVMLNLKGHPPSIFIYAPLPILGSQNNYSYKQYYHVMLPPPI
jgi:hypothetical protein